MEGTFGVYLPIAVFYLCRSDKAKCLLVSFSHKTPDIPPITMKTVETVTTARLLGVAFSYNLTWDGHIEDIHVKASQQLYSFATTAAYRSEQCPQCEHLRFNY